MNNKKQNKKLSKFKEYKEKFKETWANPQKKAGIKLMGYLLFFVVLFLLSAITSAINPPEKSSYNNKTTTTTVKIDKYNEKQNELLSEKFNINYVIKINNKEYKKNGNINNNIIEGYLENGSNIKKIVFKDNNFYEIINEEEKILEIDINKDLINVKHIINLIKHSNVIKEDNGVTKKYNYDLNELNLTIIVETNEELITKIEITNDNNIYELNFDK